MNRRRSGTEKNVVTVLCPEDAPQLSPGAARVLLRIVRQAADLDDRGRESEQDTVVVVDEREAA